MSKEDHGALTQSDWVECQRQREPRFFYWHQALKLELSALQFVKSSRSANFPWYLEALGQQMLLVFALDHIHYGRNLPIYLRDMCTLKEERHPVIHKQFLEGRLVGQKSMCAFFSLALGQRHEPLICILVGDMGIIGLTEDPEALIRNMVAGPELSRIIQEFDQSHPNQGAKGHEQYSKFQKTF